MLFLSEAHSIPWLYIFLVQLSPSNCSIFLYEEKEEEKDGEEKEEEEEEQEEEEEEE